MPSKRVSKKKVKEEKENIVKTEVIASTSGSKENKMPSIRGTKRKFNEEENKIIKEESDYDDDDYPVDYEQKRLQNIADRKAKIDELKVKFYDTYYKYVCIKKYLKFVFLYFLHRSVIFLLS